MTERITKFLNQVFRSTFEFITKPNSKEGLERNQLIADEKDNDYINADLQTSEAEEPEPDIMSLDGDINFIDIDSLMAENSSPTEEEFIEVKYIDVFKRNTCGGDQLLNQKHNVMRELLLKGNCELLSDMSPLHLLTDEELDLFLSRFRPSELLIIARVWPQLKTKICELVANQPFLWLSADRTKARFAPHEDCCDLCDHITNMDQSCIEVKDNKSLPQVLNAFIQVSDVFSMLRCLRLFRFDINEESDQLIAKICPNLLHLDLTECRITHWKQLSAQHKNLQHLILTSVAISDEIFKAVIKNKRYLKTVVVNSAGFTGKDLWLLPPTIERIDIRCCQLIPSYFEKLLIQCVFDQMKYLRLEMVFDDNTFALICNAFNNLILLELRTSNRQNTRLFTSNGLKQISRLSKLRSLKLGPNIAVHPIPLMNIFIGCPLMTHFSIDGTDCYVKIEDNVLSRMADYWPLLRRIEFKNVDCIEKETIDGLTRLENFSYLDLTECAGIDDYCLIYNIGKMPRLNYLVLDKCHRLTILTYTAIVQKAKTMDSVLSASLFRCNFFTDYIKDEVLPTNLRLTFASMKSKRFMTFDGFRVKILRCEQIHKYWNEK